jgi:hypothetical protein
VDRYGRFGEPAPQSFVLNMEPTSFFETFVSVCQATSPHIFEGGHLRPRTRFIRNGRVCVSVSSDLGRSANERVVLSPLGNTACSYICRRSLQFTDRHWGTQHVTTAVGVLCSLPIATGEHRLWLHL